MYTAHSTHATLHFILSTHSALQPTANTEPGRVSWSEIEHWLWPAFSPRWTSWRQNRLGLPPTLFRRAAAAGLPDGPPHPKSEPATHNVSPLAIAKTSEVRDIPQGTTNSANVDASQRGFGSGGSCNLPASIPLLYGLSEQVIPQPGYWPNSVQCCGFWQQKHHGTVSSRQSCCPHRRWHSIPWQD